jgi:hypothetical protein
MISTIVGKYRGVVKRKEDGTAMPYHKFTEVIIVRPIPRETVYGEMHIPVLDLKDFSKDDVGKLLAVTGQLTENALGQLTMAQVIQILPAERANNCDDPKKQRYDTDHRLKTTQKT